MKNTYIKAIESIAQFVRRMVAFLLSLLIAFPSITAISNSV
jgi:cell division protein FtsX